MPSSPTVTRAILVWLLVAAPVLLSMACSVRLELPDTAQIACTSDADCPDGWACIGTINACRLATNLDDTAPSLVSVSVTVTPSILSKEEVASIEFEVSEPLLEQPVVTLAAGTARPLILDETNSTGEHYLYTYMAAGDEPQGEPRAISLDLVDSAGLAASGLPGGALIFDFVAPEVERASITGSPTASAPVTVSFSVSEALGADPAVRLATGEPLSPVDPPTDADYAYTYLPSGGEPEDPAGVELLADLEDAAGNVTTGASLGQVVFDRSPPGLS